MYNTGAEIRSGAHHCSRRFLPLRNKTQITTVSQWMVIGTQRDREKMYVRLHTMPRQKTMIRKYGLQNNTWAPGFTVRALSGCQRVNRIALSRVKNRTVFLPFAWCYSESECREKRILPAGQGRGKAKRRRYRQFAHPVHPVPVICTETPNILLSGLQGQRAVSAPKRSLFFGAGMSGILSADFL